MSEQNKAMMRRWFQEVWNEGQEAVIDELLAVDAAGHGLGDQEPTLTGPAEFKPFVRNLRGALPDIHFKVEDMLAEGDKVMTRLIVTGTHRGPHLGVPPSGSVVTFRGIVLVRISGGKIVEGWHSWDQLGLLRQIGALAHPPAGRDRFQTAFE